MERNDVGKKPGFAPSRAASDPAPRDGPVFPRVMGRLISFRNARHCAFPARRAGLFPCAGRLTLICIGRPAENFSVFPLDKRGGVCYTV